MTADEENTPSLNLACNCTTARELEETKQQLQETQDRFHALATAIGQIVWTTRPDGMVEDAPFWCAYTGQSSDAVKGWGWLDAIHPKDRERIRIAWSQAVATKRRYGVEYRVRRADGVYHPFLARGVPVCNADGSIREWVGFSTDISERKQLEEALQESEARFRATFEHAPVGIGHTEPVPSGRWLSANQRLCELLGYSREELLTHTFQEITHPDNLEASLALGQRVQAGTSPSGSLEKRYWRKNGTPLWVNVTIAPLRAPKGQPPQMIVIVEDISQRKQIEAERTLLLEREQQARQEAEARAAELNTIFDALTVGVFIYDREGRLIAHNQTARTHLGMDHVPESVFRTPEEWSAHMDRHDAQGRPIPLEQSPPYRILRGEVLAGEEAIEERLRTLDGREMFASITGAPIRNHQGQITGAVLVGQDITERHRLAQELAARVRELEAVMNSITDAVMVQGTDWHPPRLNHAAQELLNLFVSPDELQRSLAEGSFGERICDVNGHPLPQEQYPSSRVLRGEVLSGGTSADMMIRTFEGEPLYLSVSGAPLRDAAGKQVGAVIVCRDVTERRRLEQRTQQALHALIRIAHALVTVPTEQSTSLDIVPPLLAEFTRQMLGQERVTLVSLDTQTNTLHPLVAMGLTPEQEARWRAITAGTRRGMWFGPEVGVRLHAGEVVQVDFAHPVLDQAPHVLGGRRHLIAPLFVGQRLLGYLVVGRADTLPDFTPQEKEVLGAVAHLCALVLERERLLDEREKARAHVLALEEASSRMDSFLNIASHELKTPLTSLRLAVELVKRQAERLGRFEPDADKLLHQSFPQLQENLARSEQQIRRLERLVEDLLDVSCIQAGQLELHLESADLISIVQSVAQEQQEAEPTRTIQVQLPATPCLPLWADAGRIRQVVTNYLTNALKYSPEDQPVVVGLEVHDHLARCWVRDSGPGIAPVEQAHLWERFYRVPGIQVQSGSGVGLGMGLAISRTIIERHGGQVGVLSTPGEGSTFWFTVPLASSQECLG